MMNSEEITVFEETQVIEEMEIENGMLENVLIEEEIGGAEDNEEVIKDGGGLEEGMKENNEGTEEKVDINDKGVTEELRSTEAKETKDNIRGAVENEEDINDKDENKGGIKENNGGGEENAITEPKVYTDEDLTCNICLITFKKKNYIDIHNDLIHESFNGMCPAVGCKLSLVTRTELKAHIKLVHKNTKEYKCRDCTETFHTFKMFVEHESKHFRPFAARKKQAMCEICSKVMLKDHLTRHKRMVHGIYDELYHKRKHVKSEL